MTQARRKQGAVNQTNNYGISGSGTSPWTSSYSEESVGVFLHEGWLKPFYSNEPTINAGIGWAGGGFHSTENDNARALIIIAYPGGSKHTRKKQEDYDSFMDKNAEYYRSLSKRRFDGRPVIVVAGDTIYLFGGQDEQDTNDNNVGD